MPDIWRWLTECCHLFDYNGQMEANSSFHSMRSVSGFILFENDHKISLSNLNSFIFNFKTCSFRILSQKLRKRQIQKFMIQ